MLARLENGPLYEPVSVAVKEELSAAPSVTDQPPTEFTIGSTALAELLVQPLQASVKNRNALEARVFTALCSAGMSLASIGLPVTVATITADRKSTRLNSSH